MKVYKIEANVQNPVNFVCGDKLTSGYHLALTFSKLAGLTREKQMRKTSWEEEVNVTREKYLSNDAICRYGRVDDVERLKFENHVRVDEFLKTEWSPSVGMREASAYHNLPDQLCPTVQG